MQQQLNLDNIVQSLKNQQMFNQGQTYSKRIFTDGHHFITNKTKKPLPHKKRTKTDLDLYFDEIYKIAAIKFSVTPPFLSYYLKRSIVDKFGEINNLGEYINNRISIKKRALFARRTRFYRKAMLGNFNCFYTQTYDSSKYDSVEEFRKDFKKTMGNFASRRGWKLAGCWEEGHENGRLHIHAFVLIPENQMPGLCQIVRDYSRRHRRMETRNENTFLRDKFGRNDFSPVDPNVKGQTPAHYITKYMDKSEYKMFYSRGIATYLETEVTDEDIIGKIETIRISEDKTSATVFLRFVANPNVSYHPLFRWHRTDGKELLRLTG